MIASVALHFNQPWWLLVALSVVPMAWLAWRPLAGVGSKRRALAIAVRVLVVLLLAALLADPMLTQTHDQITLVALVDRSQSVPEPLEQAALNYLAQAVTRRRPEDRLAVINVAEAAVIEKLASADTEIRQRSTSLLGDQTNLAAAVQMGLAIAPPASAVRLLVVSDGNETTGDLREAARVTAANRIPIDVLPLRYHHEHEVVFDRLVSPATARSGETISLRFVLASTGPARGKIYLSLNGRPVNLDPSETRRGGGGGGGVGADVQLKAGTNVKTISMPVGTRGLHEFEATFVPDDSSQDTLPQNNKAGSMTYVSGPGHVLVVDEDGRAGSAVVAGLAAAGIETKRARPEEFPQQLPELLDTDAVVLMGVPCDGFSYAQQELLVTYVKELGGGLVMVGGPHSFGAGGWIGSPVAEVLPIDLDPPQKKQMPKGALVLIMHSCEMPRGNYWGKQVAAAAVGTLSRLDLAGVLSWGWERGRMWDFPLGPVGDKQAIHSAINLMQMGDLPDFGPPMQEAYNALVKCDAAQKHVIIISDGDPQPPSAALLQQFKEAGITVSGVAVYPHTNMEVTSLTRIAQATGGRFYHVTDANLLPQIFIKEAQTVRRALINEVAFTPRVIGPQSEILRGLPSMPPLNGYVLTGPRGGASELLMVGPEEDPILAAWQVGVGRCAAVTTSADSRWAPGWLSWGGFNRFWEQTVRWTARSRHPPECVVFADVQGRQVTLTVEGMDKDGNFVQFSSLAGRAIGPDMVATDLALTQVGPGQYRARFTAGRSGSYLVNLKYQRGAAGKTPADVAQPPSAVNPEHAQPGAAGPQASNMVQSVVTVPYAPEFRDLSDNAPLLEEIARETGGRVLPPDPAKVDLFDRAGLVLPESAQPLTKPLILLWLVLFLLDVAVRRLAIDVPAAAGRAAGWLRSFLPARAAQKAVAVDRLRTRTQKVREQLAGRPPDPSNVAQPPPNVAQPPPAVYYAAERFEAPEGASPPMPEIEGEAAAAPPPPVPASAPEQKPAPPAAGSHLDRLREARRRARRDMGKGDSNKT